MDGLIVKVPFPLHPVRPLAVQEPVIVPPLTAPFRVSTLFVLGKMVVMVIPKVPATLPLEFPLRVNEPVSEYWFDV